MTNIISLSLLRSVLWQNIAKYEEIAVNGDWKPIVDFFIRQSLSGLLPDAVSKLPSHIQPFTSVKMKLIAQQLQVERMNGVMNDELLTFTAELERRNIPYLILKGQGVASLYPNPLHRMCGDIDLYVPMKYFKEVGREFMTFGAVRTAESRHHINFQSHGVEWELHHSIYYFQKEKRNRLFMQYVDEVMRQAPFYAIVGEGKVRVMSPTMNTLLLLSHIVDHFYSEGVGLRQLCDYALMQHHYRKDIDKTALAERLEALSLTRSYRIFGFICVHYLGMPEEDLMIKPTEKDVRVAHRVMADCLSGGNFGRADSNRRQTIWENIVFYTRFFRRLWHYRQLCPSEAMWWPLAKLKRFLTGTVHISEEKSVLNK